MLIREIEIQNVRSISCCHWTISAQRAKGWHVLLGNNGSGKSSFLRSIALALTGPHEAAGLRQSWGDWLTRTADRGSIALSLSRNLDLDPVDPSVDLGSGETVRIGVDFERDGAQRDRVELEAAELPLDPERHIWGTSRGWFGASYGPFRRFTGGDTQQAKMFASMPRLARHLSLFDERIALTECLDWLRDLKFRKLENDPEGQLLAKLMEFINASGFLPNAVRLEDVSSRGVVFRDAHGVDVEINELSDGYRSVLSLAFELVRQMALAFGPDQLFEGNDFLRIVPEGVVIIDEVDAHLHPTWQRSIGQWFCDHFPNVQFLVSTHSPLVCQSAEQGSIYLLPQAGTPGEGRFLEGDDFYRLVYGNVLDGYGTEAFGQEAASTRSEKSLKLHQRLAELNNKEIIKGLSPVERSELMALREKLPSAASSME